MDQFSKEFKSALTKFVQIWEKEKGEYNELHITPMGVIVEQSDRMDIIDIDQMIPHLTIVESCQQDLRHIYDNNYWPPAYINGSDDDRLLKLIWMLQQNEIKQKSANDRLEFYYYLG